MSTIRCTFSIAYSLRFPVDVLDDLKRVAPLRGFSGYQPLIRAYVGQGLRTDLEQLEKDPVTALVESLKRHREHGCWAFKGLTLWRQCYLLGNGPHKRTLRLVGLGAAVVSSL
jgi:hypothetical protein